jgi:uncharacterized Zn finger protein
MTAMRTARATRRAQAQEQYRQLLHHIAGEPISSANVEKLNTLIEQLQLTEADVEADADAIVRMRKSQQILESQNWPALREEYRSAQEAEKRIRADCDKKISAAVKRVLVAGGAVMTADSVRTRELGTIASLREQKPRVFPVE